MLNCPRVVKFGSRQPKQSRAEAAGQRLRGRPDAASGASAASAAADHLLHAPHMIESQIMPGGDSSHTNLARVWRKSTPCIHGHTHTHTHSFYTTPLVIMLEGKKWDEVDSDHIGEKVRVSRYLAGFRRRGLQHRTCVPSARWA